MEYVKRLKFFTENVGNVSFSLIGSLITVFQAGIEDDKLVLALEPESAALLCKQLALTKGADDIHIKMFDTGSKFMVVDCGGRGNSVTF
jgi:hypothetical protein